MALVWGSILVSVIFFALFGVLGILPANLTAIQFLTTLGLYLATCIISYIYGRYSARRDKWQLHK